MPKESKSAAAAVQGKSMTADCLLAVSSTDKLVIEKYCPVTDEWTVWREFGDIPTRQVYAAAAMGEELIVVGGRANEQQLNSAICCNLNTMKCKQLQPMATCRFGACAAFLEGFLYVVGGGGELNDALETVERWDRDTGTWSFVVPMTTKRYDFAVSVLKRRLYAAGGFNGASLKTMEYYDPYKNKWTACASMSVARSGLGLATLNNFLYAVGGFNSPAEFNIVERYDPDNDAWTTICSLLTSRDEMGCAVLAGRLLAVGGNHEGKGTDIVEEYDPDTDTWIEKSPKVLSGSCVCVVGKNLTATCLQLPSSTT